MSHVDEILSLHDSFKLFEPNADMAMKMLHANSDKNEIFKKTGHVVGVFDASFSVKRGRSSSSWGYLARASRPWCGYSTA
jgi:glycine betaine/proline transport system ATP-binding protein